MFEVGEQVVVTKKKEMIGKGVVMDVCYTLETLHRYFAPSHPCYKMYGFGVRNGQVVYIVDFHEEMGQGGYFYHELKRNLLCYKPS